MSVFAQKKGQEKIDSLLKEIPKITNDTLKGRTLKAIAEEYFFINTDKALFYSKMGLQHVSKMNWARGIAVFNSGIGRAYSDMSNYDSCMFYYNKAYILNKKADDKWNLASVLNNMGAVEQNITSNYPKATKYYFEALKMAEEINDTYIKAICLDNISAIYLLQNNHKKALDYAYKALNLRKKATSVENVNIENAREVGNSLTSIAKIYIEMKDFGKAKEILATAISKHQQAKNQEGLAKSYGNLALAFGNDYWKQID